MNTSTSGQSADTTAQRAADSFRPIDHARMVLTPVLLIGGSGYLFFGPGTLLENAAPAAVLVLFSVLSGEKFYQKSAANS
jgi:hypothetical protein